ncbi:hypothetical protein OE88DRAFT_663170 [Heliocybe sulcata]|uniref:Uncharacterized protein n=1 Tax=Heliocybe sulcata TaxID=5364 RepID=A0A5C3NES6_9AGAM|nr:hypothetical protein OE88DRAFT_663170 [Heliocybe sulcata]
MLLFSDSVLRTFRSLLTMWVIHAVVLFGQIPQDSIACSALGPDAFASGISQCLDDKSTLIAISECVSSAIPGQFNLHFLTNAPYSQEYIYLGTPRLISLRLCVSRPTHTLILFSLAPSATLGIGSHQMFLHSPRQASSYCASRPRQRDCSILSRPTPYDSRTSSDAWPYWVT